MSSVLDYVELGKPSLTSFILEEGIVNVKRDLEFNFVEEENIKERFP